MKSIPIEIIEAIRAASPIEQVIGEHVRLRRSGVELVGRCPFHCDKTPSLYVNPTKGVFHCYGCGAGGDVFEFVRLLHRCAFHDAVHHLAHRAGIHIEGFRPSPDLLNKVATMQAKRAEELDFRRFCNERIEAVSHKLRALGRAATHAEDCLRAGEPDPYIHSLAWDALERFRAFEARVEREGLLDSDVLRTEWRTRQHAA